MVLNLRFCPLSIGFEYVLNHAAALFCFFRIEWILIARDWTVHGAKESDAFVELGAKVGRVQLRGRLRLRVSL